MKSKLFAFGLAIAALPAFAQEHVDNYNRSAFSNVRNLGSPATEVLLNNRNLLQQQFPAMTASFDKLNGSLTDLFGQPAVIPGSALTDKAQYCFANQLAALGINAAQWQMVRNKTAPHASFLGYTQSINGRKVVFSSISFRFTPDGKLQRLKMRYYGSVPGVSPVLSAEDVKASIANDLMDVSITEKTVDANWAWFPVPSAQGYTLRPAYAFVVKGQGKNLPLELTGYADAVSGEILYRSNEVKETLDRTIKGTVYSQNPLVPATDEPLANLRVIVGLDSGYTDELGLYSNPNAFTPDIATVRLEGKWSRVRAALSGNVTPSFLDTVLTNGATVFFPTASPSSDRHVNAYYHVNRVHDFMKSYYPAFTDMDFPLTTNVDVTGTCNAFYNGNSINFYAAGGGCASFALIGDIIYHEYGHGISDMFYDDQGAGTIYNGALNEGNSDIWGISITHDPVLGKGSSGSGGYIRRYDLAPKVYPTDIEGEVHADGEIIAGAWWDVAVNINSVDTMTQLFTDTYYDTPDGPDGTEGAVYHDVLISALMADDDDNDLNNGTPHFMPIVQAFAKHGIYLLGDALVTHTEVANQPANAGVDIVAQLTVTTPVFLKEMRLNYRPRTNTLGAWTSVPMANTGGTSYSAQLPGQPEGTMVDYYFSVYDTLSFESAFAPLGYDPQTVTYSNIAYQFGYGISRTSGYDFEDSIAAGSGWVIGNAPGDNATAGKWIQAKPVGSYIQSASGNIWVQTNEDHTTGTGKCLVTGNASVTSTPLGTADIDGGLTTVLTPIFDISGFTSPIVEYYRWYCNDKGSNPGSDYWRVQIKDSISTIWNKDIEYTYKSDNSWRRRIFSVRQFLPTSAKISMRFMARDDSPGSAVEAAIDDLFIYDKTSLVGIDDVPSAYKAEIYPNPANTEIRVDLPKGGAGYLALYDLTGKEISRQQLTGAGAYTIPVSGVASGTYFVLIHSGKVIQSHKVTVMH